jgi:long-subunit acyl-CoA synthetase (AMP-forming)
MNDYAPGTCGKLLTSMEARLVDADGKDVKEGEAGELWIRGRNIMMYVFSRPLALASLLRARRWVWTTF